MQAGRSYRLMPGAAGSCRVTCFCRVLQKGLPHALYHHGPRIFDHMDERFDLVAQLAGNACQAAPTCATS